MVKRCTLKDIANATGLTVNSVSHALRDMGDISAETKLRVAEAAKRLGYVPNLAASQIRSGKSLTVAIVFDNLFNPYYNIMTHYLMISLSDKGYDFLTLVDASGNLSQTTLDKLISRNVDGVLSFLEPADGLKLGKLPMTVIGRHCDFPQIDYVYTDDETGGYLAAQYLAEKGCKHLCYIADNLNVSCSVDRRNGVLRFAAERGAECGEVFMEGQPYSETIGKYLAEHPDCDGIVCFNDYIAMEAQYLLRNCGRADVRVVGYDDIIQEFKLPGAYATVGTDKQKLAKTAIRLLMERINGAYEKESRKQVLGVKLVEHG